MRPTTLSHGRLQRARTYTAIHQSPKTPTTTRQSYHERRVQYDSKLICFTEIIPTRTSSAQSQGSRQEFTTTSLSTLPSQSKAVGRLLPTLPRRSKAVGRLLPTLPRRSEAVGKEQFTLQNSRSANRNGYNHKLLYTPARLHLTEARESKPTHGTHFTILSKVRMIRCARSKRRVTAK